MGCALLLGGEILSHAIILGEKQKFGHMTNSFFSHCKLFENLFPAIPTVWNWTLATVTHKKLLALAWV